MKILMTIACVLMFIPALFVVAFEIIKAYIEHWMRTND
jgi:hypothetical protein